MDKGVLVGEYVLSLLESLYITMPGGRVLMFQMAVSINWWSLFVTVLIMRARLFRVYIGPLIFGNSQMSLLKEAWTPK